MIDLKMLDIVDAKMPRLNPDVMGGIVNKQLAEVENWIHDAFRCAAESFPPGLLYLGGKRCAPIEQYREITRPLKPIRSFELTRSDVYLMKYRFTYKGVELRPQYIYLPFVREPNIIFLNGTQYKITPVIGGKVFNVERGNIYMPTPRARLGFSQSNVSCIKDNKIIHVMYVYSYLFNMSKPKRSKKHPTLIHYILAKYGLQVTLKNYFKVDSKIGKEELDSLNQDDWVVYKSRQLPASVTRMGTSEVSSVRIAIPRNQHYNLLDSVIGTIYYIIDNCAESTSDITELNNPRLWMWLLDRFLFAEADTDRKIMEKIEDHLHNVAHNMDPITKRILASDNIHCNDIESFFTYMCLNYQDIVIHNDVGSMYDKELTTVKHLMYHVVYNIFLTMYKLQKLPENLLTVDRINTVMMKMLKKNKIFTTSGHGELTPVSIASDCIAYGASANIISHSKATVVAGSKKNNKAMSDPALLLHPSQCEVSTYNWITNQGPTGRDKLSPFVNFYEGYLIRPRSELKDDIKSLKTLLSKK